MAKINITVDLDCLGDEEGSESFDEILRSEIISGVVSYYTKNIDKNIIAEAEAKIKKIDTDTAEKINNQIDEKMAGILDGFLERKINTYDKWGEVVKEGIPIIDLVKEKLDKFMTEKVDSSGRSGNYDAKYPRLEYVIQKNITHEMERRIDKAASEIRSKLEEHMQKQLEEKVGKNLIDLLKLDKM
jgi:signal recognition particle subunit SEC65